MRFDEPILTEAPARPSGTPGFDPAFYARLLLAKWPWIVGAMVVGLGIGVARYAVSPKLYQASTRLQIEPRTVVSVSKDRNPWLDQWTNMKYFPTQYRLLRSRGLAERVIDDLGLATDPKFVGGRATADGEGYSAEDDELYRAALANRLLGGLTVDPVEGTELLDLRYVGTDAALVQRITNGFAQAFIDFGIDKRRETLNQANKVLNNQIDALRTEVETLERRIQEMGQRGDVGADTTLDSAGQALLRMNEQATTAMSNALARQQRYRDLVGTPDAVIAANSGRSSVTRLESDLLAYERDYQTGLDTYKPDHPSMRELQKQMDDTRRRYEEAIAAEARAARQAAYNEWQAALRLVEGIDEEREQLQQDNLTLNVESLPLANLQMEVAAKRQRLAELVERQSEAELTAGVETDDDTRSNVHVIDTALRPGAPFRPSLEQNVTLGLGSGLLLGIALVLGLHFLDRTVKSPEDVQRLLDLPVLAVIPDVEADTRSYGIARPRAADRGARGRPQVVELLPVTEPRLAVSEAYRSLRTALLLSSADDPRLVTITSAESGEGKTATSTNLATVLAQLGKRVLLVDGDLRKPRLHRVFELSNARGLVHALTAGESGDGLVQKSSVPGLFVMTSGPHPPNPSELLASERMRRLADWARENFDFVLIDSPPVLAVSDAVLPGSISDGVVLCLRANQVERDAATACKEQLTMAGVKILGVVLNRYNPREGRYYDRRYRYYEAYAESAESAEDDAA